MNIKISLTLSILVGVLVGCSSTNTLPTKHTYLQTQESNARYFYCESCNKPTPLTVQVYKPLEPDTPIESTPAIKNLIIITNVLDRKEKPKKRVKHKRHKLKREPTRQCIEWSNK